MRDRGTSRPRGRPTSTAEPCAAASALLRATMESRGFDRRRLAKAMNVDVRTVARWLAGGDRGPDRTDAARLGDLLGHPALYAAWWPGEQPLLRTRQPASPSADAYRRMIDDLIATWGDLDDCRGHTHPEPRVVAVYELGTRAHRSARACTLLWDHGLVAESLPNVRACFTSAVLARRMAGAPRKLAATDDGRRPAEAGPFNAVLAAACAVTYSLVLAGRALTRVTPHHRDRQRLSTAALRLGRGR